MRREGEWWRWLSLPSCPPVRQLQGKAERLDALKMSLVAGYAGQIVMQGDGRNQRVGASDGLSGALQVAGNPSSQFGTLIIQG